MFYPKKLNPAASQSKNILFITVLVILLGFALRAAYLRQSHTHLDEYYSILAAQMVQQHGYPLLPSGMFYTHGILYSYLIALLSGLISVAGSFSHIIQIEMIYRVPNLLISVASMTAIFAVTRRLFKARAGLFAVTLMAVYPHSIVWDTRVRMYTLLFLFVPVLACLFYQSVAQPHNRRWYWASLPALLLALLVHNWIVVLVPALLLGALVAGWGINRAVIFHWRWWLPGLTTIALIVATSLGLQSQGLSASKNSATPAAGQRLLDATLGRLNPLAGLESNLDFFNRFIWHNPFNLLIVTVVVVGVFGLWSLRLNKRYFWPMLYLYILFFGVSAEFFVLLKPALKQPRYAAPLLTLAFIIAGGWLSIGLNRLARQWPSLLRREVPVTTGLVIGGLLIFGGLAYRQLPKIFFEGLPPVAYDRAMQYIHRHAAGDDAVLSPIPVAAQLYMDNPTCFIAQKATSTFVRPNSQGVLGDRWVGAPWLRDGDQLKETLAQYPAVWFAIDQITYQTQFDGLWKQLMRANTQKVWEEDGVMVFYAQGLIRDIPTTPDISVEAQLGDQIKLTGYSRELSPAGLKLVLFWQPLTPLNTDYTTFVHIRNQSGNTIAQVDVQPLEGQYPTSRWQPGELVVDEIVLPLPPHLSPDSYRLLVGLYQWNSLERLPVLNDTSGENAVQLETIEITANE